MLNRFQLSYFLLNIGGKSPLIICEDADSKYFRRLSNNRKRIFFCFVEKLITPPILHIRRFFLMLHKYVLLHLVHLFMQRSMMSLSLKVLNWLKIGLLVIRLTTKLNKALRYRRIILLIIIEMLFICCIDQ